MKEYYIAVARDGKEYFSDETIYSVEQYIKMYYEDTKEYDDFIDQWEKGKYGDYYTNRFYSDYGTFGDEDLMCDWLIELPQGTIENALGTKLTYEDGIKTVKITKAEPIGIKFEIIQYS